jgi:hypothetical protein
MNTIEMLDHPYEALTNIMESLVISFELSRERHRFTMVCSYPFKLPGAQGAVAGFVFDDVRDFAREEGDLAKFKAFTDRFQLRSVTGGVVIQSIRSSGAADDRHLELWLGYNFGGLQFHYRSARAYRRNALAKEVNERGLYRDLYSQEEFDFYEPFPDLMAS